VQARQLDVAVTDPGHLAQRADEVLRALIAHRVQLNCHWYLVHKFLFAFCVSIQAGYDKRRRASSPTKADLGKNQFGSPAARARSAEAGGDLAKVDFEPAVPSMDPTSMPGFRPQSIRDGRDAG